MISVFNSNACRVDVSRWDLLNEKEKQVVRLYIVEGKKMQAVAFEMNMRPKTTRNLIQVIYRALEVEDQVALALWVGRHWETVTGNSTEAIT